MNAETPSLREDAWAFLSAWYADGSDVNTCDAAVALLVALTPGLSDIERADMIDQFAREMAVPLAEERP